VNTKVYVEGGGDGKFLKRLCRRGFNEFFRKAGLEGRMPRIIASGSRNDTFSDFCTALKNADTNDFVILLIDAENPVEPQNSAWDHLARHDRWARPEGAECQNAHLMVQCMESWFLADREVVEDIQKKDVIKGLENATRPCQKKGKYSKSSHSFHILEKIDPDKIFQASPHARLLIQAMKQKRVG